PSTHYLHAGLVRGNEVISENRMFFREPKHLRFPMPRIATKIMNAGEHEVVLTIRSSTILKNLLLEIEGADAVFDDNYFDLDAGVKKDVIIRSALGVGSSRKKLRMRWLE